MTLANLLTDTDRNLILTGYTGPNQPAIGRGVARALNRRLVTLEDRLEAMSGLSVEHIRSTFGQARLKTLEAEVMGEIMLHRGTVIRVNGETLSHGNNLVQIQQNGPVICLVASLDAVLQRLHLAMGARFHNPAERDLALGELRRAWFARGKPDVHEVDATYLTEAETIEQVIQLWRELSLVRGLAFVSECLLVGLSVFSRAVLRQVKLDALASPALTRLSRNGFLFQE